LALQSGEFRLRELNKCTFSAYYKAFDLHLSGLQELAKSGSDVNESNKYASELAGITSALQQINREEEKLVNICTINIFSAFFSVHKLCQLNDCRLKIQRIGEGPSERLEHEIFERRKSTGKKCQANRGNFDCF
jgi:hypothetical protein